MSNSINIHDTSSSRKNPATDQLGPESRAPIKVWDMSVRLFHWSLVAAFIIAYLSGEDDNSWHIYSGYFIAGLLVFRLTWGFIGSHHARFSNFVTSPARVVQYLKSLLERQPVHYTGHNPAGGYMVLALLFMLSVTTLSGLKLYGVEGHGPLAVNHGITLISTALADDDHSRFAGEYDDDADEEHGEKENPQHEFWEELHEISANLTVLLILLHIAGVVVSSRMHRENLVKAMITGRKSENG